MVVVRDQHLVGLEIGNNDLATIHGNVIRPNLQIRMTGFLCGFFGELDAIRARLFNKPRSFGL